LQMAEKNEQRIDPDDLVTLRRVIYQSMHLAFQRGRLVTVDLGTNVERVVDLGPNLNIIPNANKAYEDAIHEEKEGKFHDGLLNAHRYFLLDVVFFLYMNGREADANQWYLYLADKYPDKRVLNDKPESLPRVTPMMEYVLGRTEEEVHTLGEYKTRYMLEGLERQAFMSLALDEKGQKAKMLDDLAQQIWSRYQEKIGNIGSTNAASRLYVAPLDDIRSDVLRQMLSGELPPELTLRLAAKTGQTNLPPTQPNAPPPAPRPN